MFCARVCGSDVIGCVQASEDEARRVAISATTTTEADDYKRTAGMSEVEEQLTEGRGVTEARYTAVYRRHMVVGGDRPPPEGFEWDTRVPSISDIRDGFWTDRDGEFTKGADCKYWIPPSRILYVMKGTGQHD